MSFGTLILRASGSQCRARGKGQCRSCGLTIFWATTSNDKAIPFDRPPEPLESWSDGDAQYERVVADTCHWRTCEKASAVRLIAPRVAALRQQEG